MAKAVISPDRDAVICEVLVAAPPERIFHALSSEEQLGRWWNGEGGPCRVESWHIEPRLGGKWSVRAFDPTGQMAVNGVKEFHMSGEIVEFDPPRALAYSWFGNFHSDPSYRSMVRWELIPEANGTLVRMTHSGLKGLPEGAGYADGWPGVVDSLVKFFANEKESAA